MHCTTVWTSIYLKFSNTIATPIVILCCYHLLNTVQSKVCCSVYGEECLVLSKNCQVQCMQCNSQQIGSNIQDVHMCYKYAYFTWYKHSQLYPVNKQHPIHKVSIQATAIPVLCNTNRVHWKDANFGFLSLCVHIRSTFHLDHCLVTENTPCHMLG